MKSQLLASLLLGITLAVSAEQIEQKSMLGAFELSCKDCNTMQFGDPTAGDLTEFECAAGTLCGPVNGAFACVPEAEAADCSCAGEENTYIPEPYDNTKYIACLPGGAQSTLECDASAGEIFTGDIEEPCATGPTCESALGGFNPVRPECNQYFFCTTDPDGSFTCLPGGAQSTLACDASAGEIFTGDIEAPCATGPTCDSTALEGFNPVTPECNQFFFCTTNDGTTTDIPIFECSEGQVFDTTMLAPLGCVDPCSLAPEPFACESGMDGVFPDQEDCTIFHICFGGVEIGVASCSAETQFFNAKKSVCEDGVEADICTEQVLNICYDNYKDQC